MDTSEQQVDAAAGAPEPIAPVPSTARAVRWSAISTVSQQVGRAAISLAIARIIGPEAFGVAAQAYIVLALAGLLLDQGLVAAIVQRDKLDASDIGAAIWLTVAMTCVLALVIGGTAGLIAAFFETPDLRAPLRVLVADVLATGLAVPALAILMRDLRFRALAVVDVLATLTGGVVGVGIALAGGGLWSPVAFVLTADLVTAVGVLFAVGRLPIRGSVASARSLLKFSSSVLGFQVTNYLSRYLDNVIVARVLGPAPLAQYALSYRVMLVPVQNIGWLANRVALPLYSRYQRERGLLYAEFVRYSVVVAAVAVPLMAIVFVTAPIAVPLVFGDEWRPAVVPMQILAATGARQAIHTLVGPVFLATGRPHWQFRFQLVSLPVYAAAFLIGVNHGIAGVAAAYTIAGALLYPAEILLAVRSAGGRLAKYVAAVGPVFAAGIIAAGVGRWLASAADVGVSVGSLVGLAGAVFAVYVITLAVSAPGTAISLMRTLRLRTA